MFILTLSIISLLISVLANTIIQSEYVVFFGTYILPLNFGEEQKLVFESINQETLFTWTSNSNFDLKNQTNYQIHSSDYTTIIGNNKYSTIECSSKLFLNNETILDSYHLLILTPVGKMSYVESGFAFAMKIKEPKTSITHQLYSQSMISKLAYALYPVNRDHGYVYFGGIPNEIQQGYQSFKCKSNTSYDTWGCDMSHIFIGHISYENPNQYYLNQYHTHFQASTEKIFAPEGFIYFLNNSLFNEKVKNSDCRLIIENSLKFISCECEKINDLNMIHLIFDGMSLQLNPRDLFKKLFRTCEFVIVSDSSLQPNEWVFGTTFISLFPIEFNYNDNTITFYSKEEINKIDLERIFNTSTNSSRIGWFILLIVLIGVFGYRRFTMRKQRKMKNIIDNAYRVINTL